MASLTRVRELTNLLAHPDLSDDAADEIHADLCARLGVGAAHRAASAKLTAGGAGLTGELTAEQKKAALTLIGGPDQMKRFMKFRAEGDAFFDAEEAHREQLAALSTTARDGGLVVMR
jgi:hypothetical protein